MGCGNNGWGGNCWWIVILILVIFVCGGQSGCGNGCDCSDEGM